MDKYPKSGYVNSEKLSHGEYEFISSYRSNYGKYLPKQTTGSLCSDKEFTAYNPISFTVNYKLRRVRVKQPLNNGRYRWKYVLIRYPYVTFKKETYNAVIWKFILQAAEDTYHFIRDFDMMNNGIIRRRIRWLKRMLAQHDIRKKKCTLSVATAKHLHNVTHLKINMSDFNPDSLKLEVGPWTFWVAEETMFKEISSFEDRDCFTQVTHGNRGSTEYQFIEYTKQFAYESQNLRDYVQFYEQGMLLWLWPSTDSVRRKDDSRSQLFVTAAEAISDGTLLGETPNIKDIYNKHNTYAKSLKSIVDFAANTHLWVNLVIRPLMAEISALTGLVPMLDRILDDVIKMSKADKWIQGDTRPYFKEYPMDDMKCLISYQKEKVYNASLDDIIKDTTDYPMAEAYGQLWYKLDHNALSVAAYTTRGRLALGLSDMSTSLSTVAYELIPFSFVYDYFDKTYQRSLAIRNKVFIPLDDYKLGTSIKYRVETERKFYGSRKVYKQYVYKLDRSTRPYQWVYVRTAYYLRKPPPTFSTGDYKFVTDDNPEEKSISGVVSYETIRKYVRFYSRPKYDINAPVPPASLTTPNPEQTLTLGALLWSILT